MAKLKALQVINAKGPCKLSDGKGLYFQIMPSGHKRWIYRFKIAGRESTYIVGHFPDMSLEQARQAHAEAHKLVKRGINPSKERKREKLANIQQQEVERLSRANSFEFVALEWIEQQRDGWSKNHTESVLGTLRNDVFGKIGEKSVDAITPPEILIILRNIEKRGSLEIARKVLQRVNAVFRYAIQTGRATYNPAAEMKGVLKAKTVTHMPAVFYSDFGQLLKDITANQRMHINTKLCLQFMILTAARPGEARGALWPEIMAEDKEWHVPAPRMKMRKPHIVPLSKQALAVLHRAATIWGTEGLIFPGIKDSNKPLSDNTLSKALRDMGYRGIATPHGCRSSFSSMAYEKSGFPGEVIEKALAHEEKNKIKAAYNRAEYLEQRRELLAWWGDLVHHLEYGAEIIPINLAVGLQG